MPWSSPIFLRITSGTNFESPFILTMLGKSYNSAVKKGQMDCQVRFWNEEKSQVDTHYYASDFLGKSSAVDVCEKLNSCCSKLPKENI